MIESNNKNMNIMLKSRDWKNKNKEYLKELECFLDKVENIEKEELRKEVIFQMLKCDEKLTLIAEKNFIEFYKQGYKKCKGE